MMSQIHLYPDIIKNLNKEPLNYFKNENSQIHLEAYNPLCGDHYHLYIDIDLEDDRIKTFSFFGYGCAISKASSSILTKRMVGLTPKEGITLYQNFYNCAVLGGDSMDQEFIPFQIASNFPGREECAILSWKSLYNYFREETES